MLALDLLMLSIPGCLLWRLLLRGRIDLTLVLRLRGR